MKTIQIILDVQVADEEQTPTTVLHRWKQQFGYPTLLPGVVVHKAVALPVIDPNQVEPAPDSLNAYPGVSTRLLSAVRLAKVYTIPELAEALPDLLKLRNVGDAVMKEAIRICVAAGEPIALERLLPAHYTYAKHLLDTAAAGHPGKAGEAEK